MFSGIIWGIFFRDIIMSTFQKQQNFFLSFQWIISIVIGILIISVVFWSTSCYEDSFPVMDEYPELVFPPDGSIYDPIGTNTFPFRFEWLSVENATKYTLIINDVEVGTVLAPSTSFTDSEAIQKALTKTKTENFSWYVAASNYYLSRSSERFSFTIKIDSTAPSTPESSIASGIYCTPLQIELTASDNYDDFIIYYTLDGSTPSSGSYVYEHSLSITDDTDLRAIAIDWAGNQSQVGQWNYNYSYLTPAIDVPKTICEGEDATISWVGYEELSYVAELWNGSSWIGADTLLIDQAFIGGLPEGEDYLWRLQASTTSCTGEWVVSESFQVNEAPASPIINPTPDTCLGADVNLSWSTTEGFSYTIYYDTDNEMNTEGASLLETTVAPNNTLSSPIALDAGTYYWKMISHTESCGEILTVAANSFEVIDPAYLLAPNPSGNVCEGFSANLTWDTISGYNYDIYYDIDSQANTTDATFIGTVTAPNNTLATPPTPAAGTYYWKIIGEINGCTTDVIVSSSSFDVAPISDASNVIPNGDVCDGVHPNVTWTTTASHSYDIYYATDNATDTTGATFVETITAPDNTLANPPSPSGGTYYWKVVSKVGSCTGNVIVSGSTFEVTALIPASNVVPDGDVCEGSDVNLSWTTTVGYEYDIYYDTDNTTDTIGATFVETITAPDNILANPPAPTSGTYYWKVVTKMGMCISDTVAVSPSFIIHNLPTAPTALVAPTGGCASYDAVFNWTDEGGTYTLEYGIGAYSNTTSDTGGSITVNSLATGSYQWRVKRTVSGCESSYTTGEVFYVGACNSEELIDSDPFGDSTSAAYIFGFDNKIYIGPNATYNGAVRMNPDGSNSENITFSIAKDVTGNTSSNSGSGPFNTFGVYPYTDDASAGPDKEEGVELFASGNMSGSDYLLIGPRKTDNVIKNLNYFYYTSDTDTQLDFSYFDGSSEFGPQFESINIMVTFNSNLFIGGVESGGSRPFFIKVTDLSPQDPVGNIIDLFGKGFPDIGKNGYYGPGSIPTELGIDSAFVYSSKLYLGNAGGIARSTASNPGSSDWEGLFSDSIVSNSNYDAYESVALGATYNIHPYKKAIPQMAEYKGYLFWGRNVGSLDNGAQLFRYDGAGDLILVADNGSGLTNMGDSDNKAISLVATNGDYLYIGFDNTSNGFELWRANVTNPSVAGDFTQISTNGLGNGSSVKRSYANYSLQMGSLYFLYLTAGNDVDSIAIYRFVNE
jgi:hypothetical protein